MASVCADRRVEKRSAGIAPVAPIFHLMAVMAFMTALLVLVLAAGCSQLSGFKDPKLVDDDGGVPGDASVGGPGDNDASVDGSIDASIDAPASSVTELWIFVTNGAFQGDLGGMPGRVGADARCDATYRATFMTTRQCTAPVRAVLQVDNASDTLDRMGAAYQIPATVPVLRATDAVKVANVWSDVVTRTTQLLEPVSASTSVVFIWSGRGVSANRHCNSWQSKDPALIGDIGDATKIASWLSQTTAVCDSVSPRLLCVCW